MKLKVVLVLMAAMILFAAPGFADLEQATATVAEGAVEFPLGLIKLVGGLVWTVGEVIVLPFRLLA